MESKGLTGLSSLGSTAGWLNIYVEQALFDLANWRRIKGISIAKQVAQLALEKERETTSLGILHRYAEILHLQGLLDLDEQRLKQAEWLDNQAKLLLEAGRTLRAERQQVELNLAEARIQVEDRRQSLGLARNALWRILGNTLEAPINLKLEAIDLHQKESDESRATEFPIEASPDLRILRLRQEMAETLLSAARAERLPTLGVQTAYSHYGTRRFDNFNDEIRVGIDVSIPIFDGFRTHYSIEEAIKDVEIAHLRYEAMHQAKGERVRAMKQQLEMFRQRPGLAKRRAVIAGERIRLADLNLQAERGSLDEALAARIAEWRDARAAAEIDYDHLRVWGGLNAGTGQLARKILGPTDPELEPSK